MWWLNEETASHMERSGSQRSGAVGYACQDRGGRNPVEKRIACTVWRDVGDPGWVM